MLSSDTVEVEVECPLSRSGITFKRFEIARNRKL
jgi:hypothetical protein